MIGEPERTEVPKLWPEMMGEIVRVRPLDASILEHGGIRREQPLRAPRVETFDGRAIVRQDLLDPRPLRATIALCACGRVPLIRRMGPAPATRHLMLPP